MFGREWKNHKYIRKEGNRYIYPEDLIRTNKPSRVTTWLRSTANKARTESTKQKIGGAFNGLVGKKDEQDLNNVKARISSAAAGALDKAATASSHIDRATANTRRRASQFMQRLRDSGRSAVESVLGRSSSGSSDQRPVRVSGRSSTRGQSQRSSAVKLKKNRSGLRRTTPYSSVKAEKTRSKASSSKSSGIKNKASNAFEDRVLARNLQAAAEKRRKERSLGTKAKNLITSVINKLKRR